MEIIQEKTGMSYDEKKLMTKNKIVLQKDLNEINHNLSLHSRSLQRSKYIQIDDDINRLKRHFEIQNKVLDREEKK